MEIRTRPVLFITELLELLECLTGHLNCISFIKCQLGPNIFSCWTLQKQNAFWLQQIVKIHVLNMFQDYSQYLNSWIFLCSGGQQLKGSLAAKKKKGCSAVYHLSVVIADVSQDSFNILQRL